jgi:rRNA-processing protein FCF1
MAADRRRDPERLSRTGGDPVVLLDSNFLFIPIRFGVDIFEELERLLGRPPICLVPEPIIEELRKLRLNAKPSFKKKIDFALEIANGCKVLKGRPRTGETVDDFILRSAADNGWLVATNDSGLRRRLRDAGVPVIYLRQRAYLEVDGYV